jgi:hypothetical protein
MTGELVVLALVVGIAVGIVIGLRMQVGAHRAARGRALVLRMPHRSRPRHLRRAAA